MSLFGGEECPPFTVTITEDLNAILAYVKREAAKKGITFQGNTQNGSFHGMGLKGKYTVSGNQVTIKISSTPPFYTCAKVEVELRRYFEGRR